MQVLCCRRDVDDQINAQELSSEFASAVISLRYQLQYQIASNKLIHKHLSACHSQKICSIFPNINSIFLTRLRVKQVCGTHRFLQVAQFGEVAGFRKTASAAEKIHLFLRAASLSLGKVGMDHKGPYQPDSNGVAAVNRVSDFGPREVAWIHLSD